MLTFSPTTLQGEGKGTYRGSNWPVSLSITIPLYNASRYSCTSQSSGKIIKHLVSQAFKPSATVYLLFCIACFESFITVYVLLCVASFNLPIITYVLLCVVRVPTARYHIPLNHYHALHERVLFKFKKSVQLKDFQRVGWLQKPWHQVWPPNGKHKLVTVREGRIFV